MGRTKGKSSGRSIVKEKPKQILENDAHKDLTWVTIPESLEKRVLHVVNDILLKQPNHVSTTSKWTSKKLTEVYSSLQNTGFKTGQIEDAMSATLPCGGDLADCLDWLCVHTNDSELPSGFSASISAVGNKEKFEFVEPETSDSSLTDYVSLEPEGAASLPVKVENPRQSSVTDQESAKEWIMRYASCQSSDEETEAESPDDPNSQYLLLSAQLLDLQKDAKTAKTSGNKGERSKLTRQIRQLTQELHQLELQPGFDDRLKSTLSTDEKSEKVPESIEVAEKPEVSEDADMGFALFDEDQSIEPSAPKVDRSKLDVREFSFTRQQWTGKHPKQFLIDWCRKHRSKDPPPKYRKVHVMGNLWRSRCLVSSGLEKGKVLDVCPDICTENLKEAEFLASTLALYELCKGQSVDMLLPPPYRVVWKEWADAEKQKTKQESDALNKPRDAFVTKLMKQLKKSKKSAGVETDDIEEVDDWEQLDDGEPVEVARKHTRHAQVSIDTLRSIWTENKNSETCGELFATRSQLPVFEHKQSILEAINRYQIVILSGETGSGKSTQVPQFILEQLMTSNEADHKSIIITEPRRLAATSLAQRVSQEMGESRLGTDKSLVGYQIRLESKMSRSTRLLFCTVGILLRRLQSDKTLSDISHVIIDEVHERSVDSDFLLILLRRLLHVRPTLKLLLMSATADTHLFCEYLPGCAVVTVPGRTHPVEVHYLEDCIEQTGYALEEDSIYATVADYFEEGTTVTVTGKRGERTQENVAWSRKQEFEDISGLPTDKYSLRTRAAVSRARNDCINFDLLVETVYFVCTSTLSPPCDGAILIFLPGLADIQEVIDMLQQDPRYHTAGLETIALHSAVNSSEQLKAFKPPSAGCRKVVVSTNIAETGLTIPDVTCVIDSGSEKQVMYSEASKTRSLVPVRISRASARQRQGRAGRVKPGHCFHLFTRVAFENNMNDHAVPEIRRVPLEELCLYVLKSSLGRPAEILADAIDPPTSLSVTRAMKTLSEVKAIKDGQLTALGQLLADLPVDPRIGKMMIYGAALGCVQPICVLAASMSCQSPFVASVNRREEAETARKKLSVANSDHLTLYNTFTTWKTIQQQTRSAERKFLVDNFLKRSNFVEIDKVSRDLCSSLELLGFPSAGEKRLDRLKPLLLAALTAGLYPNVAVTIRGPSSSKGPCYARLGLQGASIPLHPSSVNRQNPTDGLHLVYFEKVKHGRVYVKDVSVVSPVALLLFGGDITVEHERRLVTVEDRCQFRAYAKTAVIFKEFRKFLDSLLQEKIENPSFDLTDNQGLSVVLQLIKHDSA